MKYIYLSSLMIALSAFFLIGCENAEYKAQSNSLYITDAAGTMLLLLPWMMVQTLTLLCV